MAAPSTGVDVSPSWQAQQMKAFGRWAKLILSRRQIALNSIEKDFQDGIAFWHLIDELSSASYVPPLPHPRGVKDRIQAIDNLNLVFAQLKNENLRPVNISEVDIADGNVKLTLGLLWLMIQKFAIGKVTAAKDAASVTVSANSNVQKNTLLSQLRDQLKGCNLGNNPLNNFKEAFQDGLVLCALIHKADPKLIDYKQLSPSNKEANIRLAFSILEKNFNLPNLLDVEDVLSSNPDERSMMTFVAHVFNRLTQGPEQPKQRTQANQPVSTHKKGKFQELMGQVGMSAEDIDQGHYVPAPLGGRGAKLERSNTGVNAQAAPASPAPAPIERAPLTRSVTAGATQLQPVAAAAVAPASPAPAPAPTFAPPSPPTPAPAEPQSPSPVRPETPATAPGVATVQFIKETIGTPPPLNTDSWEVLSKTAITHTAIAVQQSENPQGHIDALCAAFGEVVKVCRVVAARQEPPASTQLLDHARAACDGLSAFAEQRQRGVSPDMAKTAFLEPMQNVLRALKPWFESQKKKQTEAELASRPIADAAARFQGGAVNSGEEPRSLARKAVAFANQIGLNMNVDPTCVVLAITTAEAIDTARAASAVIPGAAAAVPPIALALATAAQQFVHAKVTGAPLAPFHANLSTALQAFSAYFNAINSQPTPDDEQRRLQEAAERKRAEELRQIEELRRLEEELMEEETQRDEARKRQDDQRRAAEEQQKAAQLAQQREEEERQRRAAEEAQAQARAHAQRQQAEAEEAARQRAAEEAAAAEAAAAEAHAQAEAEAAARRQAEEDARRHAEAEAEAEAERQRQAIAQAEAEEAQRRQEAEEAEAHRLQEEAVRRQQALEAEELRREIEAQSMQARQEEETRQRLLNEEAERQRALDAEMSRLQAEEEAQARQMQALAEEERRRQEQEAEEDRLAEEAHARRLEQLAQDEEAQRKQQSLAASMAAIAALEEEEAILRREEEEARAQREAVTATRQRAESQQDDAAAARLEAERARQAEEEEERRRKRDEEERLARAQEERRIADATRVVEEAAAQLGVPLPAEPPMQRFAKEAEGCVNTVGALPADAHPQLAQQIAQLLLITRKVSSVAPSGHLLEAARTVAKHACRYLASHAPSDDPEEAEQQREITHRGLSFGLQTLAAALASACSREPAAAAAPAASQASPDAQRAAEQIEQIAANIGRNPALVAVNFDGIFESIKQHITALNVERLRSKEDLSRYVGAVAAVVQATEQVAGIEPDPLRRQQLLDLARSAAAVSIRLLVGEPSAQAENVRALNTTLQALFGLMKAVIHQSGPQADDDSARAVREAAERVEKGQVMSNPPSNPAARADEFFLEIERAIDTADFAALAPVAAGLLDTAGAVLSRRPADAAQGAQLCRSFAAAAISFLRLTRRKNTGSLRGQTPSPVALLNEATQLHAWISKSAPGLGPRNGPDMEAARAQLAEASDRLNRMSHDVEGSLDDLKLYAQHASQKLDAQLREPTIDATPIDKVAGTVAKLMDVAVCVESKLPQAAQATDYGRRLAQETSAFLQLAAARKDSEALQQRAVVSQLGQQLAAYVQSITALAVSLSNLAAGAAPPSPPLQAGGVRDNPYLDEGLNTLAEGRNRIQNGDTDIEGELEELVAFSAKRRNKLHDVLMEANLDQLDYLRLAELTVEVVETNTALARSHPQASAALMASGDRLLSTAQHLLETSRARQDAQAHEAVEAIKRCAAQMDAELKNLSAPKAPAPIVLPVAPDSPRHADVTPRQFDTLASPKSAAAEAVASPRSQKAATERSGPPDADTLKAIQELVKLTMAELSRVDAPGQKNNEDPQALYDKATAAEQAMERHMQAANRNAPEYYVGAGQHLRELLGTVKALLNTDAFDDAMKRKRVAEAAKEVGNALFKFTYLKKANDTEGTLDTAQTAINNTLRSLLLQLKPGPVLKRNLTPAAAIAAEAEKPVPLTPTPPSQSGSTVAAAPQAKNEDVLKAIQEGLRIILEVIEGINGPAAPTSDSTDTLVARAEALAQALPSVIRVDGTQRTDYVQLAQLVASIIDNTRTVASREDDPRRRQLLDAGRALGNALLKFIYSRKSGAPIDDAQRLLQSFVNALLDALRKSTGRAAPAAAADPLAPALQQALDVVTEGTAVVERPLAVDTGRDPQRSLEQARLCASQIEESAQLGTREEVITHANNVMSLLDLCRGLGAACRQPQQRDRMVQAGKRFGQSSIDLLNARRGGDRSADAQARNANLVALRELLDALNASQASPFGATSMAAANADVDAAMRTLRVALDVSSERLPSKGKLELEETCATAEELAVQALSALRQNRPPTRLADLVAELVDLARCLPLDDDSARLMADQTAQMCRIALQVVESNPRRNESPELPTAIRRVVDSITDFARRKKTSLNPEPVGLKAVSSSTDFDLPAKIITEALDKIGKPIYPPYQEDDLSRTGGAVVRLLETEPTDPLAFAKAVDALVDAGRAFGALMQLKATSQPARPAAVTDPSKPRKVGVFKKASQGAKKSRTGWKERLVCLRESHIEYYAKPKNPKDYDAPNKKDLKGTIELKEAQAVESTAIKDKKLIVLELRTPRAKKGLYFIQMPNKDALEDWIRAINGVIESSSSARRPTMVKPPYEGPLILAETRSIASEAFNFVQLLKEREKREQLQRTRNVLLEGIKKLSNKKST